MGSIKSRFISAHISANHPSTARIISGLLPYPGRIVQLGWQTDGTAQTMNLATWDIFITYDPLAQGTDNLNDVLLGDRRLAGASPPDFSGDPGKPFWRTGAGVFTVPFRYDVPGNGWRFGAQVFTGAAGTSRFTAFCVVEFGGDYKPSDVIDVHPRGTEDDPVCVHICKDDTTRGGGGGGTPPTPPSGPPSGPPTADDLLKPPFPDVPPFDPDGDLQNQIVRCFFNL